MSSPGSPSPAPVAATMVHSPVRETNGVLWARMDSRRYHRRLRQRRSNSSAISQIRLVDSSIGRSSRRHSVLCICAGVIFTAVAVIGLVLLVFRLPFPPIQPAILAPDMSSLARLASNEKSSPSIDTLIRLPKHLSPLFYHLHLRVYLPYKPLEIDYGAKNMTFEANIELEFHVYHATRTIKMHAKNLTVDAVTLKIRRGNENPHSISSFRHDPKTDILALDSPILLRRDSNYTLSFSYRGLVNRPREGGLFAASYLAAGGEHRLLAATQMQPLDARRLLPCWDEPEWKAEFRLSIVHPVGTHAISNTAMVGTPVRASEEGGWLRSEFATTPRMATYLLALAITDFPFREAVYNSSSAGPNREPVTIRLWSSPPTLHLTEHALQVALRSLEYFEHYFQLPYPLSKLDIVGVPHLRVAAMENWGLVFCRQQSLLYTADMQTKRDKQFVTDVLAHEIAHMWFGDLVTMEWWDDLWLNEGFATLMGMKAADYVERTTIRQQQLFYERTAKAFRFDQLAASHAHPLSWPIHRVREVFRRFDPITYLKAAAVLRMVEGVVGEEPFRRGLNAFLQQFAYRNARSRDLLETLARVAGGVGLSDFIHSWTYHGGFPVIEVLGVTADDKPPSNTTRREVWELRQRYFSVYNSSGTAVPASQGHGLAANESRVWKVPLFTNAVDGGERVEWLDSERGSILQYPPHSNSAALLPFPPMIDADVRGYYRVLYSPAQYDAIRRALLVDYSAIPVAQRARLIEDAFTLARYGRLNFSLAFGLCEYLRREEAYLPLLIFNNHLQVYYLLLRNHVKAQLIKDYAINLLSPVYHSIFSLQPTDNASDLRETMQEFAMTQLCYWGYEPCIERAQRLFARLKAACRLEANRPLSDTNCNPVAPALRAPVYATAISHGDEGDFNFLLSKLQLERFEAERNRILGGLAASANITLVSKLLEDLVPKGARRPEMEETYLQLLLKLFKSPILNEIIDLMRTGYKSFSARLRNPQLVKIWLTYVTKWIATEEELSSLTLFELAHKKELAPLRLDSYLSEQRATSIRSNIDFTYRHATPIIDGYLQRYFDARGGEVLSEHEAEMGKESS